MILAQEQAEIRSLLEDFKSYVQMRAKQKLREPTLRNYTKHIRILISKHSLPAENPTVEDFREAIIQRVGYISAATANTAICAARKFAEFKELDPDTKEMRKIFQFKKVEPTKRFTREDILLPEDIIRILDATASKHYRALFAVLWDTGARIGEICSLNYKDVIKDDDGFVLDIKYSKTTARRLRLITDIGLDYFAKHYEDYDGGNLFQMKNGSHSLLSSF